MHQGLAGRNFQHQAEFDTFKLGQIANIQMAIDLGETGRPSAQFQDGRLLAGACKMGYRELPEGFRATVDEMRQRMANIGNVQLGSGRRQIPPAP